MKSGPVNSGDFCFCGVADIDDELRDHDGEKAQRDPRPDLRPKGRGTRCDLIMQSNYELQNGRLHKETY